MDNLNHFWPIIILIICLLLLLYVLDIFHTIEHFLSASNLDAPHLIHSNIDFVTKTPFFGPPKTPTIRVLFRRHLKLTRYISFVRFKTSNILEIQNFQKFCGERKVLIESTCII